jgi:hypothetical protein
MNFIKTTLIGGLNPAENDRLKPVLVSFDDSMRLGLEVERIGEDRVAVYFPGSPNAWSGLVNIVTTQQVKPISAPMMSVIDHAEQLGRGAHDLLAGELQSDDTRNPG